VKKAISKVFSNQDSTEDILFALEENGLVLFSDMASGFTKLYKERLRPVLPEDSIQSYTNHPTEGYFYFIYNNETYTREQVLNIILKFRV
jgi:hypothetical protein